MSFDAQPHVLHGLVPELQVLLLLHFVVDVKLVFCNQMVKIGAFLGEHHLLLLDQIRQVSLLPRLVDSEDEGHAIDNAKDGEEEMK